MKKEDYAHTVATLLSLDRVMEKDLMKLEVETLAKMYANYIQNAKDANNHLEKELHNAHQLLLAASRDKVSSNNKSSRARSNPSRNKRELGHA